MLDNEPTMLLLQIMNQPCHEKRPLWGQMTTCQEDKKIWKLVQLLHSTFTAKDHKDTYELTLFVLARAQAGAGGGGSLTSNRLSS